MYRFFNKSKILNRLYLNNKNSFCEQREQLLRYLNQQKDQNKYEGITQNNIFVQEYKTEIEKKYKKEQIKEIIQCQLETQLGANYELYKGARHKMHIEGLECNEIYYEQMIKNPNEIKIKNNKIDYVVKGKQTNDKRIQNERGQTLQKIKELDYLDHQYQKNKDLFKYKYENVDDHFSRFISSEEFKIQIGNKKRIVLQDIEDNTTIGRIYELMKKLKIEVEDIEIIYDISNRATMIILELSDIDTLHMNIHKIKEETGYSVITENSSELLNSIYKTVVVQNIDVQSDIQSLVQHFSQYGRIMRFEIAQVIANPNKPDFNTVQTYLTQTGPQFQSNESILSLLGTNILNRDQQKHVTFQNFHYFDQQYTLNPNHEVSFQAEPFYHQNSQIDANRSLEFIKKHFSQNIFEFQYCEVPSELNLNESELKHVQRVIRSEKTMNNLGYVILEYSQIKEAKGCLFDINLRSEQYIADLLLDKTHLCSDPFYFYQKLRRIYDKINNLKSVQQEKNQEQDEEDFQEVINVEDIFERISIQKLGGDYMTVQQTKVLEAFYEEKEFNDNNNFSSVLEKYVEKYDRVGRQKLNIDESDMFLFQNSVQEHIKEIDKEFYDKQIRKSADLNIDGDEYYQKLKEDYDQMLYEVVKGEYSDDFLWTLFLQQNQKKFENTMIEAVDHIQFNGIKFIKESEITELLQNNYKNSLLTQYQSNSLQEYVDAFYIKQKISQNFLKNANIQDFNESYHKHIAGNEKAKQIPQEFYKVENKSQEEIEQMINKLNQNVNDNSTLYEQYEDEGVQYIVKYVKDINKPDIDRILSTDKNKLRTQIENELTANNIKLDLDSIKLDQLVNLVDVDSITQEDIQQMANDTNLSVRDVEAILFDQISQQDFFDFFQQEEFKFQTRMLREDEFIQDTSGKGAKNQDNKFNKSKYKLI